MNLFEAKELFRLMFPGAFRLKVKTPWPLSTDPNRVMGV